MSGPSPSPENTVVAPAAAQRPVKLPHIPPRYSLWLHRVLPWLPWLVLLMGLGLTLAVNQITERSLRQALEGEFAYRSEEIVSNIAQRLHSYELVLQGTAGLFAGSQSVRREEFRIYVESLRLDKNYPGIQGVGFAKRVHLSESAQHIAQIRREGFPDYRIHPECAREVCTPIVFLEPFAGRNLRAFGFDISAESVRREAMERAQDENVTAMSGKITLLQEGSVNVQAGFLMVVPVYRYGAPLHDMAARREALQGWAYAPFRMGDLMAGILGSRHRELHSLIDFEIYDGETTARERRMFDSNTHDHTDGFAPKFRTARALKFGGHQWLVVIHSLPRFESTLDDGSARKGVAAGILISGLLALILWLLISGRERALRQAALMTRDLSQSESLFRATFEQAAVGIAQISLDGRWLKVNQRLCDMVGYSSEELLGGRIEEVVDLEDIYEDSENMRRLVTGETSSYQMEKRYTHRDGHTLWVNVTAALVRREGGTPDYLIEVVEDITIRKITETNLSLSQQHYASLLAASPVGVYEASEEGMCTFANPRWLEITGLTIDQAMGDGWVTAIHPDDRERVITAWCAATAIGQPFRQEFRFLRSDGAIAWVLAQAVPVASSEKWPGFIGTITDITERRRAEDEIRRLNAVLANQVQDEVAKNLEKERLLIQQSRHAAMGEMIGNIAHQWRQPLNALGLLLGNIRDAWEFGEMSQEYLDRAMGNGRRYIQKMSTTIDDFRNFFRPNKEHEHFSLRQTIDKTLAIVEHSYHNHNIEVRIEASGDIEAFGFPNEFSQVLLNLLSNAKDALLERKIPGGIVLIRMEQQGDKAEITVSDNAGGIAPDVLPKVFDPYYTTREKGTGIGLYMSRMILDHMQGSIDVRNGAEGAEFIVTLPIGTPP